MTATADRERHARAPHRAPANPLIDLQRAAGASERLMELLHEVPVIRAPARPLRLRREQRIRQSRDFLRAKIVVATAPDKR